MLLFNFMNLIVKLLHYYVRVAVTITLQMYSTTPLKTECSCASVMKKCRISLLSADESILKIM